MEKIKIAICGIGRAGWGMHTNEIDSFSDMFEIVGAYDVIPLRMEVMQKRYPNCKKYNSFEDLLADDNVEMITVANRSPQHIEYGIKVLEAGKYLLMEKPVALNYENVLKLKAVADKYPGKLFCRQNRRFESAFQHVKEIIASGILGEVFEIKLCRHHYQRRADWQVLDEFGGGQLNNWGPHLIDHALQFVNYDIASVWGDVKQIAAAGDANDHFKAIIKSNSGLIVDVEVSGGISQASPVYAVYGTNGSLIATNESEFKLKYLDLEKTLPKPTACRETPDVDLAPYYVPEKELLNSSYCSTSDLVWIEETIPCNPKSGMTVNDIYKYIYKTIREGAEFPVKNEEAFEVVRVSDLIKQSAKN